MIASKIYILSFQCDFKTDVGIAERDISKQRVLGRGRARAAVPKVPIPGRRVAQNVCTTELIVLDKETNDKITNF